MANEDSAVMTPVAAVTRHLEWLEFALAAARDEETRRRERLGRATDKNRDKRSVRLAEVTAEVRELGALVKGLKELQARPAARAARARRTILRRSPASTAKSKTAVAASTSAPSATAAPTVAATPKAKATTPAKPKPKATATAKPKPKAAAKPRARRGTAKPATPSA
jgi:hypothetical protein